MSKTKVASWFGAALLSATIIATPAHAGTDGIYTWEFGGYFPTKETCAAAKDMGAVKFRCDPAKTTSEWELWNAYYE